MTRHVSDADSPWLDWHGLGGWNVYFLAKFALLWAGYLNFHPLINLVFAAFLIFPLPGAGLRRLRHWLALPIGVGIFYHDTWLPGIESILDQGSQVFSFTLDYWLELLGRFINWEMVGIGFVMLTLYLFIAQWLRFTPWILLALGLAPGEQSLREQQGDERACPEHVPGGDPLFSAAHGGAA